MVDSYGDPLPVGATARLGTMRLRYTGWHKLLAFAENDRTLITATGDHGEVRLWDARTGHQVGELDTSPFPPRELHILPDGETLITYGTHFLRELKQVQPAIQVWDVPSRKLHAIVPINPDGAHHERVSTIAIDADGKTALLGTEIGNIRVLDLESAQEVIHREIAEHRIESLAIAPDGELVAAATRDGLYLWNWFTDDEPIRPEQAQFNSRITSLVFGPDGKTLAVAYSTRGGIVIWDVDEWRPRLVIEGSGNGLRIGKMAFINNGEVLVAANHICGPGHEPGVLMWNVATGERIGRFRLGVHGADTLAVSAGGKLLAAMGDSACRIWDVDSGREVSNHLVGHLGPISSVAYAEHDDRVVTSDYEGTVRLWNGASGKQLRMWDHGQWIGAVAISRDGQWIASSAEDLRVWNANSGEEKYRLAGHGFGARRALAFTADGGHLVSWGDDDVLRHWDMQTGNLVREHSVNPHPPTYDRGSDYLRSSESFALSPDTERFCVTAGEEVHIFDVSSGAKLRVLPIVGFRPGGRELQLSPEGSKLFITAAVDAEVNDECIAQMLDIGTGEVLWERNLPRGSCGPGGFSPDGTLVAAAVLGDVGTILVWDAVTGTEQNRIDGIPKSAWGGRGQKLAVSPDNTRLALAMMNTTTLVWDIGPAK